MQENSLVKTFDKNDIQKTFNISLATVNNWIKEGVIPRAKDNIYTKKEYDELVNTVKLNSNKLKSRANRSFKLTTNIVFLGIKDKGRQELLMNLVQEFMNSSFSVYEGVISLGRRILQCSNLYDHNNDFCNYIDSKCPRKNIFNSYNISSENDDILGAFYQSIVNISNKAKNGLFYTPPNVLSSIKIPIGSKVVDPCCGSGSILINTLSRDHNPSDIYAYDIDEVALFICRINLILFFNRLDINPNIGLNDLLFSNNLKEDFDYVITNPPWGGKLSKSEKSFLLLNYPELKTTETFSIALYNSINMLNKSGQLCFILPESSLNVSAHKNIRKYLLKLQRDLVITPLGVPFKGVQSECIILSLSEVVNRRSRIVIDNDDKYEINNEFITYPNYFIPYSMSYTDNIILKKIYSAKTTKLSHSTKFGMGIVTGDNKKYLQNKKNYNNNPVYRGKDILPYFLLEPQKFINFNPEVFQQAASKEMYSSKKIIYRFISNKIICMLDSGNYILNSANMIISTDYPMEILVCLYNSPIYTYIYQKLYRSKKVLRQHFESFPLLPLDDGIEKAFMSFYGEIISNPTSCGDTQKKIDIKICEYFKITMEEYEYILRSVYGNFRV